MPQSAAGAWLEQDGLLLAVAEQLKIPLTLIARRAELSELDGLTEKDMRAVRIQADAALQLVDSYMLGLELLRGQTSLALEPVSVSSTLVDTAHVLTGFAKQYSVDIAVDIAGPQPPVMAHARGLRAALLSLGFGLIEAQAVTAVGGRSNPRLVLAAHRTSNGIIAGVYGSNGILGTGAWRQAFKLCGQAPQPFTGFSGGTGAGLFLADTILRSMESGLRVGIRRRRQGLAATFRSSKQLQFV